MSTSFFSRRDKTSEAAKPVSSARVGQFYLDTQRRLLHCLNETAREFVKEGIPVSREDLEKQPLKTLAGQAVTENDLPLLRAWREGRPQEATFLLLRPDFPPRHLNWNVAPLVGNDHEVQGVLATLSVAPPEPDWHELASLAHDLRTPLQSLRLLIPVLEAVPLLNPDAVEALERLRSAADRAMDIGMDLLEWARGPTQASRPVARDWVPLGPMLKNLAGEQLPLAQRKNITLITDLSAAQDLQVQTDKVRLARLLANLLSNAVRYTPSGEVRFTASWREEGGRRTALALTVADTGSGISPEDQESIFQPFERGKAGKESDSGGSGLGLAVVDRLVQELGLTLEVFSEYGHGSSFDLLLPAEIVQPTPPGPAPGPRTGTGP